MKAYLIYLNIYLVLISSKSNLIQAQCNNVPIPRYAKTTGDCVSSSSQNPIRTGSVCTIICFAGCRLSDGMPSTKITCVNNNGVSGWDKPIPESCNTQQCDPIGPIQFGSSCASTNIGQTCTLGCNPGYRLSGSGSFMCTDNYDPSREICPKPSWSPSVTTLPTCIRIQCPSISNPIGGNTRGNCINAGEGQDCTLICGDGYFNNINNGKEVTVRCQSNGQWDQFPQCIRQTCPSLEEPVNGRFTGGSCAPGVAGVSCEFSCNNGFSLQPPERTSLLCREDGTWTENGVEPTCVLIQCRIIFNITIENGGIVTLDGCYPHVSGSTCRFFCNENYDLIGPASTSCLQNGQWFPAEVPPTCQLITCPNLMPIEFGSFEGACTPGRSGEKCTFHCNPGYGLVGDSVFQCLPTGNWDKSFLPSCVEILCPNIASVRFGTSEGDCAIARPGNQCVIRCMDGTIHDLTCGNDGIWNDNPVCIEVVCPAILSPPNARISGSCEPGVIGETCNITCNTGFAVDDPDKATLLCTPNGWDKEPAQCVVYIPCPNIANPDNGEASGDCAPGVPSSTCSFTCSEGYDIEGESELTCNSDGSWSDKPPICIRKQCPSLTPPPGVRMSGSCTPGLSGMNCMFSCPPDLSISGPRSLSCLPDGTWSENVNNIRCQSNICPKLPIPIGGKPNKYCSPGRIGRRCQITCVRGYKISGQSSSLCTLGSRWVGKIPRCLRQCVPIRTTNGRLRGQCSPTGLEGRSCTLYCNANYRLVGRRTSTCNANGLWSSSVPRCVRRSQSC